MDKRFSDMSQFVQRRNMSLSDNKCDKRIINESNKKSSDARNTQSNNNIIYLKIEEKKTDDKKLSILAK